MHNKTLWYYLFSWNFVNQYLSKDNTGSDDKHFEGHGVSFILVVILLHSNYYPHGLESKIELK